LTSQAALMHNMISQAESIFKTSITLISELPDNLEGKQYILIFSHKIDNFFEKKEPI